ncbi:MAG: hypothetical protein DWB56_08130 [Candidatus Jettenia sp.]|uniref:Uncharacterized protein n=1 Tax=Candidatus Jettenia caeni TaxID=247490 RepID=I3IJG2_9BACT|nr:hypothetical protein [Candidatus Jettenia sp. AMX1]MBC6928913.1 hypothetical protein [Candidatus Jettenia sp.]NUN24084.1 hypothetical protein [Candidatus Jettenia caeni]KAA0250845.1 MAG: hypothetical protein EDM77_03290 [Candidatus Jettenia sp. AMX1]MCE7879914.1 hypothetical protein [Candidatus Jettenia sp. AMX1]MCQ3926694.1 hypothetical protein [Candidatus Jettenia sp.]
MNRTNIHIDRFHIRLKGISPQTAHSLVNGLGNGLLGQLAKQSYLLREKQLVHIDTMNMGILKAGQDGNSANVRGLIIDRTASCIKNHLG